VRTEVVSHHVFRRTARKQERALERRRLQRLADAVPSMDNVRELNETRYRVAKRRGGMRWVVEKVTR
jgi:hypothetical protein